MSNIGMCWMGWAEGMEECGARAGGRGTRTGAHIIPVWPCV